MQGVRTIGHSRPHLREDKLWRESKHMDAHRRGHVID